MQAHSAVHELQTAVRERPTQLLTQGCASTLARLYELGELCVSNGGSADTNNSITEHSSGYMLMSSI